LLQKLGSRFRGGERWLAAVQTNYVLILLRHEPDRLALIGAAQQGHRESVLTSATINRRRMVAMEFAM
jgi:hypothetical protein